MTLLDYSTNPDPTLAAKETFAKLGVKGEAAAVLMPAVIDWFRRHQRGMTREVERRAAETNRSAPTRVAMTAPDLLRQGFVGVCGWVSWSDATIADHQAYIDMLVPKVKGLEQTISLHRKAIEVLQASGRVCLGELAAQLLGDAA